MPIYLHTLGGPFEEWWSFMADSLLEKKSPEDKTKRLLSLESMEESINIKF